MPTSSLIAMATFDENTKEHIHQLKIAACENQTSCDLVPTHLTLGLYSGLPEKTLIEWAKKFSYCHSSFPISFENISCFGERVCFLAPTMNTDLLLFYLDFHQKYDEFASESGQFYSLEQGKWVPHCTLFLSDTESVAPAYQAAKSIFIPFTGTVTGIAIGQDFPLKELAYFPLLE